MPTATEGTPNEAAILGAAVVMIVPSSDSMKKVAATSRARSRCALGSCAAGMGQP
jgi:hypothetical protein